MPTTRSQKQSHDASDLFEPTQGRARPTSNARRAAEKRPSASTNQQARKKRTSNRLQVSVPNDEASTPRLLHEPSNSAATVTPASATSTRVRRQLPSTSRPRLPEHVVDIFDANLGGRLTSTFSETSEETMQHYITGFLHAYGPEYYQQLYMQEEREYRDTLSSFEITGDLRYQLYEEPVDFETPLPFQPLLTIKMRHVLIAWLAEVVVEFKLSQAAYHLAVSMLDGLLLMGPTLEEYKEEQACAKAGIISDDESEAQHFLIKPRTFQAIGCTCIWVASKIEDRTPPTSEQLSFISDNACSADSLLQYEARIMELFKFRPLRVTPVHFLDIHERASNASTAHLPPNDVKRSNPLFHHMMEYILQLSRTNYQLMFEKASLVAAAASFLSRAILGLRSENGLIWTPTLEYYTGYPQEALNRPLLLLLCSYMEAEHLNKPLFSIYKNSDRYRVSLKTAPRMESLGFDLSEDSCLHDHIVDNIIGGRKKVFLDES